ncbi:MAG: NADP-dependent phosphogluconate dehydrogenase [Marinovum sp.]|nr:NADP-dependent phosphogluconate dehydrogenase [Marinovum sp.]
MTDVKLGLVGLGVMGSNLALNIVDNGFPLAVYNRRMDVTEQFMQDAGPLAGRLHATESPEALVARLTAPRAIIMMVTAGAAVDSVIASLLPHLDPGDIIIDAGNADFNNTRRREKELADQGVRFVGMGVSGGAEGARNGPSIMVGGAPEAYARIQDAIEAIAADYEGESCAAHLGPDGAGHFVKTVHNGIEYADMQIIAEAYGLMRSAGKTPDGMAKVFQDWNKGALKSYLIEITAEVLAAKDPGTDQPMVDVILDRAGQKGTGRWTLIEALKLGQSASTIEAAVGARSWSSQKELRVQGETILDKATDHAPNLSDNDLEKALLAARIIAYAQGFSLLAEASDHFAWSLDLARTAEIWRAGCIIRAALLDDISDAFRGEMQGGNLMFAPSFAARMAETVPSLRKVVAEAAMAGQPSPAFASALSYFDTMHTGRGTAALIQGQRDFFGEHGFERVDREGDGFHGPWVKQPG